MLAPLATAYPRTSNPPERQVQERGRGATILPRLRAELRSFERARSSNYSLSTFRRVIEEKGKGRLPKALQGGLFQAIESISSFASVVFSTPDRCDI